MKLYYISQTTNNDYDTYDSAVVAANSEEEARAIHPAGLSKWEDEADYGTWVPPQLVSVEHIGAAKKGTKVGVICASFHAG